ncbi:MAG TPA: potassium-transporting ATPase subunit KdpA [Levilinea sp.]|nr:potassium-transporting ATPase subunit KdpA [Levilinea sp.]
MTWNGWLQILLYLLILILAVKPLGGYMAKIHQGERVFLTPVLGPTERWLYRLASIDKDEEMNWKEYAGALLLFSAIGLVSLFLLLIIQQFHPLNPMGKGAVSPDLAFNTATSFVTNTNWQNYGGEGTLSYLSQMLGLTVQNFFSAAAGMGVLVAFIRGFTRHNTHHLGNFWVDLTRSILYILLPLSLLAAIFLVSQGVVQTIAPSVTARMVESSSQQTIAVGPAASQIAIKMLGTNGGGFFNANSAHPFENPSPVTNFVEMVMILLIPGASCYMFGRMVKDTRQGWAILAAMLILLVGFIAVAYGAEAAGNPALSKLGVDPTGGNMEGKEVRFGVANSALWSVLTTAASNGSVNSMHASYTPLGGLSQLVMMMVGEVVFGGVGSGLYGMLVFVVIAVFVAGLMVGRTPEYLGKKIEAFEVKMVSLLILIMPLTVLVLTALAVSLEVGRNSVLNPGAHGFSEILYAFTSQGNNNGSAFAGLNGDTVFYNLFGALAMLVGRFGLAIPTLALAGSLANKKIIPIGAGTLSTTSGLFIGWLIAVILLVGALNFIPALALGPVIEHLIMTGGM